MRKNNPREIVEGQWYPVAKQHIIECCDCGMQHLVDLKIGKNGVIWQKVWVHKRGRPTVPGSSSKRSG